MAHRYILACFVFIFCRVDGESLYGLKGLSVSLEPAIPSKPADILWKHNGNKLVEFNGNEEHVYGTFAKRITLDWHTAEINITDLRFEDSGNFELEATINNMLHRSSKTLVVIDKVPKPTISCKMNDGSSSNKSGTLECSAESQHSQTQSLLRFEWESHGNVQPGPQLTISLGDEHDDHEYICNVRNPKSSETTTFTAKDCYPAKSSSVALVAGLVITLFLIIFVVLGIACYRKRKAKKNVVEKHSQPGSDQTTAQDDEKQPFLDEATTDQQPDMTKGFVQRRTTEINKKCQEGGKMNEGKASSVPPCSELSPEPAKEEVPQSDPSVSEKANEPDQADESADSKEDKMFESSSTAPEESGGKMNEGKASSVPPCSELSPEPAEEEVPQSDPSVSEKENEPDQADESADSEEVKMSESSSTAPEESELKKEAEKDGEANVPSDNVFPAKALSPLTQNSPKVAPENAAGEQSEDMNKAISSAEEEPANEEIDKEKDLYGDTSQQPHSPIPTKPDNEHTDTLQESPDTPHKTPDQEKKIKTTQDSDESSEDENETAQCGPKEEKPDQ